MFRLCADFPHLKFTLNGGVLSLNQAEDIFRSNTSLHGIMFGRAVYSDPVGLLWDLDSRFYNKPNPAEATLLTRRKILSLYCENFLEETEGNKRILLDVIRPLYSIFYKTRGVKLFKQRLNNAINIEKMRNLTEIINYATTGVPIDTMDTPVGLLNAHSPPPIFIERPDATVDSAETAAATVMV